MKIIILLLMIILSKVIGNKFIKENKYTPNGIKNKLLILVLYITLVAFLSWSMITKSQYYHYIQIYSYIGVFAIIILLNKKYIFNGYKNFLNMTWKELWTSMLFWFIDKVGTIVIVISYALFKVIDIKSQHVGFNQDLINSIMNSNEKYIFSIVMIVIGPFIEEIIFRNILWDIIEKHINKIFAYILTSILFGLLHTFIPIFFFHSITDIYLTAIYTFSGFIFGFYKYRENIMYKGYLIHMLTNAL